MIYSTYHKLIWNGKNKMTLLHIKMMLILTQNIYFTLFSNEIEFTISFIKSLKCLDHHCDEEIIFLYNKTSKILTILSR